jgi:hypothetical protein
LDAIDTIENEKDQFDGSTFGTASLLASPERAQYSSRSGRGMFANAGEDLNMNSINSM